MKLSTCKPANAFLKATSDIYWKSTLRKLSAHSKLMNRGGVGWFCNSYFKQQRKLTFFSHYVKMGSIRNFAKIHSPQSLIGGFIHRN